MPGVNLTNMTPIRSWREAQAHWEANRPTRARGRWPADSVALDGPRKPHVRLRYSSRTNSYHATLYDTDLVTYHASGEVQVILDARRASIDFLRKTLPAGLEVVKGAGKVWLEVTQDADRKVHVRQAAPSGIWLQPGVLGSWAVLGAAYRREVVLVQHRKIAGIEKRCRPLKEWLRSVHRLGGVTIFRRVRLVKPYEGLEDAIEDRDQWGRFIDLDATDVVAAVAASSGAVKVVAAAELGAKRTHPIDSRWSRRLPPIAHYSEMAFI